jgi:hypothetical protein
MSVFWFSVDALHIIGDGEGDQRDEKVKLDFGESMTLDQLL